MINKSMKLKGKTDGAISNQRKKISKACDICKRRKMKCNGLQPCLFCSKRGLTCSYLKVDGRSLKGRTNINKKNMVTMDISNIEAGYGYITTNLSQSASVSSSISSMSNSSPPTPIAIPPPEPSMSTILQNLQVAVSKQSLNSNSNTYSTPQDSVLPLTQHDGSPSRLLMTESGDLRFYGKTSPVAFLNECRVYFSTNLGISRFSKIPSQETIQKQQQQMLNFTLDPNELPVTLPDEETCELLIDIFTDNINSVYYVFDMEYFRNTIFRPIFENDITIDPVIRDKLLCLIYMVFAISTLYIRFKDPNQLTNLNLFHPQHYLQASEDLLKEHPHKHHDKLWIAEYHLLTYFYYISCCNKASCWIHLGISIRICQALGLYDSKTNNQFANRNFCLHRKKLWRSIIICDRICSISFGRPLTINMQSYTRHEIDEANDLQDPFQYHLYLMSSINGAIIEEVYRHENSISIPNLQQLCQDLTDWNDNVPQDLKLNWDGHNDFNDFSKVFLHLNYLFGIINLGRPIFMNFIHDPSTTFSNNMIVQFTKLTIKASYLSLQLIKTYLSFRPDRKENFLLITMGLYSSLILGMTTLNQRKLIKHDEDYIRVLSDAILNGKEVLTTFGKYDKVSRHWSTIVVHILDCLKQPIINNEEVSNIIDIPYSLINIRLYDEEDEFESLPTPQVSSSSSSYDFEDEEASFGEDDNEENSIDKDNSKGKPLDYTTVFQSNKLTNACIQDLITLTGYEEDSFLVNDFNNKVNNEFIAAVNLNTMVRGFGPSAGTLAPVDNSSICNNSAMVESTKPTPGNDLEAFRYDFNQV